MRAPHSRFLTACLLLAAGLGHARADQNPCRPPPPEVNVSLPSASISVRQVRDVGSFAAFGSGGQAAEGGGRWVVNGLTRSTRQVSYRVQGLMGGGCFAPVRIEIMLGVADPVEVLISDKYAPGTCQYQAILEHEMQHVDILRRGRQIYAERYRSMLGTGAVQGPYPDEASAQSRIAGLVDVVNDEMTRALAQANASIDTAQSYLANQARCPSW